VVRHCSYVYIDSRLMDCYCANSNFHATRLEYLELTECALDLGDRGLVANTLPNLAEYPICQSQAMTLEFEPSTTRFPVPHTTQMVDPHRCITTITLSAKRSVRGQSCNLLTIA